MGQWLKFKVTRGVRRPGKIKKFATRLLFQEAMYLSYAFTLTKFNCINKFGWFKSIEFNSNNLYGGII
jgi:hypothetical protein